MKFSSPLALAIAGVILLPQTAGAHHSFAMFDREKTLTMSGTVKEVQWTNPHVWVYIVAANEQGQPEEWGFETGPTNVLLRAGWKRTTLSPGDKISLTMHPMKNGSHAGSLEKVTLADGTVMGLGIQGAKPEEGEKLP
jgi:hypothetical protein